jgi:hypothetical protein
MLSDANFRQGPDGESYFTFNEALNAAVEVSDYRKVLHDAVKRNKAFFHKLGLHAGARRPRREASA